ncbi:hypothetical protein ORV05_11895 [Amycolatopsis cynarae]|uniref:PH domain-containing protein n=1 Tax=Amycolatopsis cynarae TaxID=2995223 RepID=A0ABY7B7W7_9PSEU|nr:hypothetical protein [Amycolatopsis sp. HUAS 11-8]WAL68434.1 hypothetical protein ORV05_11895 [Amycolatopsis sp. HUAS 11-8]
MGDRFAINEANFAGRLHPSQRRRVLENVPIGLFLFGAGVYVLTLQSRVLVDAYREHMKSVEKVWFSFLPVLVLVFGGLWIAARRLLEAWMGRVVTVTGPVQRRMYNKVTPASQRLALIKGASSYSVKIGDKWYNADRTLYNLAVPGRINTGFVTPWTKRLMNVVPRNS